MSHIEVKGCCPLDCQDGCSWVAHVEDGAVTKVLGAKDHPFTRGVLCAKVHDYQARTYAPNRLLHPLRRAGAKGSGAFERVGRRDRRDCHPFRGHHLGPLAAPQWTTGGQPCYNDIFVEVAKDK